jgi:protein gp37
MATGIAWTGETWNPLAGCSLASAGCRSCYAMDEAWRKMHHPNAAVAAKFAGTAMKVKGRAVWTGRVNFHEPALMIPIRRRKPQIYFVNSLSDLFHKDVPPEVIDRIFAAMVLSPQHIFQVLTKRDQRMHDYLTSPGVAGRIWFAAARLAAELGRPVPGPLAWPLANVWLGVSAENQRWADARREALRRAPAAVKFVSYEPAIGAVDWTGWEFVDQIISGGESGPRARLHHPDWHRATRDFCARHGIAYFFKQWGMFAPLKSALPALEDHPGMAAWPDGTLGRGRASERGGAGIVLFRGAKGVTSNELDGKVHEAVPAQGAAILMDVRG